MNLSYRDFHQPYSDLPSKSFIIRKIEDQLSLPEHRPPSSYGGVASMEKGVVNSQESVTLPASPVSDYEDEEDKLSPEKASKSGSPNHEEPIHRSSPQSPAFHDSWSEGGSEGDEDLRTDTLSSVESEPEQQKTGPEYEVDEPNLEVRPRRFPTRRTMKHELVRFAALCPHATSRSAS